MLYKQLFVEWKRACTVKNVFMWTTIVLLLPTVRFCMISEGYQFYQPVEVFQETISAIIPLLFPVLVILIYLPSFVQEQRNHFITYTRMRIPLNTYLLSKGVINAFLTGFVLFLLIFLPFLFIMYVEPRLGIIYYTPIDEKTHIPATTFSSFLSYGDFTYGLIYALWVSINGVVYSTIAFMLLLTLSHPFVALSFPFVFYHIVNFVTGILNVPMFSPLSTIFPFNIEEQPLWTVLVPFTFLLIIFIGIFVFLVRNQKEWMI
ncbi:ABC transporter permease [Caldibacillus thermoamylovorans]